MRVKALPRSKAKTAYDLIGELITEILAEPARLYMDNWVVSYKNRVFMRFYGGWTSDKTAALNNGYDNMLDAKGPACGTVGCAAGWICLLRGDVPAIDVVDNHRAFEHLFGQPYLFPSRRPPVVSALDDIFHSSPSGEYGTKKYVNGVVKRLRDYRKEFATELKTYTLPKITRRSKKQIDELLATV